MKVLLIVLSIIVIVIGGAIGAGYWWWSNNEAVINQQVEQAFEQASDVAQQGDSFACINAAKLRVKQCSDMTCQVAHSVFVNQCLQQAPLGEDFCKDSSTGNKIADFTQWSVENCADMGDKQQACIIALSSVADFCANQSNG